MKGLLKKFLVLIVALGTITLSACTASQDKNPNGTSTDTQITDKSGTEHGTTDPGTQTTDPGTQTTDPGTSTQPPVVDVAKKVEEFCAVRDLAVSSQNFTVTLVKNENAEVWKVNPNAVMIGENQYFSNEEGKNYLYNLETKGWVREETESANPADELVLWINSLNITNYIENSDSFEGNDKNNHIVVMYKTDNGFYFSDGETAVNVTDITVTNVRLPENWTEKEIVDPEPPIENKDALVDANGFYKLDVMKDLLLNWIKNDNQFGKDVLAYRLRNDNVQTQRILYANPTDNCLKFGLVYTNQDGTYYNTYSIENIDYETKNSFVSSLKALTSRQDLKLDDAVATQIDTTVSDEDVVTRTANVMIFLGKGDEDVVDVCESVNGGASLTFGAGFLYRYLIVTADKAYFVTVDTVSKEDVAQNTNKWSAEITKTEIITKASPEKTK